MAQYQGKELGEAAVIGKLQAELAFDAQVLIAKFKGFASVAPGFGAKLMLEVIEPMVQEMVEASGPDTRAATPGPAETAESVATVHHLETRRPAVAANYTQQSTSEIQACIVQTLEAHGDPMRLDDLQSSLEDQNFQVTAANLSVILHRMVRNGLIHRPIRGAYAALADATQPRRLVRD